MKPTTAEITQTVADFGALKYFPADENARGVVMRLLASMVATGQQLAWLRSVMLNQVGEWPGTKELRAIFCTRFRPADGAEVPYSVTGGFTAAEIEAEKPRVQALTAAQATRLLAQVASPAADPLSAAEQASVAELDRKVKVQVAAQGTMDAAEYAEWQRKHEDRMGAMLPVGEVAGRREK